MIGLQFSLDSIEVIVDEIDEGLIPKGLVGSFCFRVCLNLIADRLPGEVFFPQASVRRPTPGSADQ